MEIHCGQPADSSVQEVASRRGFLVYWSFVILVRIRDVGAALECDSHCYSLSLHNQYQRLNLNDRY